MFLVIFTNEGKDQASAFNRQKGPETIKSLPAENVVFLLKKRT